MSTDPRVDDAREEIQGRELELNADDIALWFAANPDASPTGFALDFGIDPSALKSEAAANELVRLALYRMIALSESIAA